ncbi:MAG: hypothetical protein EHM59_15725 [Betaproteobacteria bacterium]|nr:MAG: hypothetical protein EHM59_15725 [Betaproteobacteria bacterium]
MNKLIAAAVAAMFAASMSVAYAAQGEQKKEQIHKGTPEAGTVQKKEQQKAKKKDGSGAAKKAETTTK